MATALLARRRNGSTAGPRRWAAPAVLLVGCLAAPATLAAPLVIAAAPVIAAPPMIVAPAAPQEGQIFVRIIDQNGAPLGGVRVTSSRCIHHFAADNLPTVGNNCKEIERTTDDQGQATFPSVRIGPRDRPYEYWVVATKDGYTTDSEVITLHPARNEIPLTMHEVRSNPTLVRFEEAQAAAEAGDIEAAEEQMAAVVAEMSAGPEGAARGRVPRYVRVSALSLLADYRLRLERYEAAEQALEEVLALDPWDRFALRSLVITAAYRQDWAQAEERARDYLDALPANADALLLMGNVYLETGRLPQAIDSLERSELLDPDVAVVHRSLGNAYEMARRPQDAIRHYQRYLEIAGNPADRAQIEEAIARLR